VYAISLTTPLRPRTVAVQSHRRRGGGGGGGGRKSYTLGPVDERGWFGGGTRDGEGGCRGGGGWRWTPVLFQYGCHRGRHIQLPVL